MNPTNPREAYRLTGFKLSAEYGLTPRDRAVSVRAEMSARWTQGGFFLGSIASTYQGAADFRVLAMGVAGTLTAWPKEWFSPYLVAGVAGAHRWSWLSGYYQFLPNGELRRIDHASSYWGVEPTVGLGLRARLGNQFMQLEARRMVEEQNQWRKL